MNGKLFYLMCTSDTATAARFEIDRIESVHISGVTFQGCTNGAIQMSTVTRATIKNATSLKTVV